MDILTGFVTVRKFNEFALPVPIQNNLLRSYASEKNLLYKLPSSDIALTDNHMMLFDTIKSINPEGHLGMCSIHMFPSDIKKLSKMSKTLINKNVTLHFIFEKNCIKADHLIEFYLDNNLENIVPFNSKISHLSNL